MATFKAAHATLAAGDLERAKSWYADKLGLKPFDEDEGGAYYKVGDTQFMLYPSQFAGTSQATSMDLRVDDIEATVDELSKNGVTFEQYDLPYLKTDERGIATMGDFKGAWFKDSEGNIIAVGT